MKEKVRRKVELGRVSRSRREELGRVGRTQYSKENRILGEDERSETRHKNQ